MVTTFELPGCHDMWTVISNEVKEDRKVPPPPRSLTAALRSLGPDLLFHLQNGVFLFLQSQAAKSSSDSDDVAETDKDEDGEEGKPEQDETEKEKEEKEKENTEPPAEEDTKKHGFLILSREDSTMVGGRCLCVKRSRCVVMWTRSIRFSCRSCRPARRSWSWTPVGLPLRDQLCSQETLVTTNTSSRSPPWGYGCWKEVGEDVHVLHKAKVAI